MSEKKTKLPFFGVPKLWPFIRQFKPMIVSMIVLNLINSENPDLIITGLNGNRQNLFMIQNQTKVLGKIWMNLGQSPHLLEAVGYKQGWLTRRRIKRYFCDIFVENE